MIKTLRITSYLAAILAVIFIVFPVIAGVRGDENIEELVNSPSVIEKFNKTVGSKAKTDKNQTSPLVKQAESFALYLNPPKPKTPTITKGRGGKAVAKGPAVTPKFPVIGISYYKDHPESSLALIDEPGKGLRWVRQSDKVGHILIEQIKDGVVVTKSGGKTYELTVEQKQEASLLAGAGGVSAVPSKKQVDVSNQAKEKAGSKSTNPSLPAVKKTNASIARDKGKSLKNRITKTPEEEARYKKLVEEIRKIQRSSDKTGSKQSEKERAELIDKIISQFNASRLTAEEAKKLDTLGKELKEVLEESDSSLSEEKGEK